MSNHDQNFQRRAKRTRYLLKKHNSSMRLRLSVHRTGQHMYAQVIDDATSSTLVSASTRDKELAQLKSSTLSAAYAVGELVAKRAREANIEHIVFDRGGYIFHGRIKAVADGARASGLNF
ncbi:MAG: 50S ribosomal protein L18 [Alphaproteobacteria bacterium]|nr:MAG: 50S ribosomal protein L18 [Alphaproteobacteria bacterium]